MSRRASRTITREDWKNSLAIANAASENSRSCLAGLLTTDDNGFEFVALGCAARTSNEAFKAYAVREPYRAFVNYRSQVPIDRASFDAQKVMAQEADKVSFAPEAPTTAISSCHL